MVQNRKTSGNVGLDKKLLKHLQNILKRYNISEQQIARRFGLVLKKHATWIYQEKVKHD